MGQIDAAVLADFGLKFYLAKYRDDEGDLCSLSAWALSDALDCASRSGNLLKLEVFSVLPAAMEVPEVSGLGSTTGTTSTQAAVILDSVEAVEGDEDADVREDEVTHIQSFAIFTPPGSPACEEEVVINDGRPVLPSAPSLPSFSAPVVAAVAATPEPLPPGTWAPAGQWVSAPTPAAVVVEASPSKRGSSRAGAAAWLEPMKPSAPGVAAVSWGASCSSMDVQAFAAPEVQAPTAAEAQALRQPPVSGTAASPAREAVPQSSATEGGGLSTSEKISLVLAAFDANGDGCLNHPEWSFLQQMARNGSCTVSVYKVLCTDLEVDPVKGLGTEELSLFYDTYGTLDQDFAASVHQLQDQQQQ